MVIPANALRNWKEKTENFDKNKIRPMRSLSLSKHKLKNLKKKKTILNNHN